MRLPTILQCAIAVTPVLLQSVTGWSFTMYNDEQCHNEESSIGGDSVQGASDGNCHHIRHARRHRSIRGDIPYGSNCRVEFYPDNSCSRSAFSLTGDANQCFYIGDYTRPLNYYRARDCS
ncbi:uncharacterized protein GGS25DRAFT_526498 [Hypoxylon fragiforme]|uniref:uncharacterized protein n=1 Tax=Hypoxylon fragiforme TaxID=63214 RepID=UPI0020C73393|nr:uncharacterized protein GGS25DRAFT_526498 [Hypoxylon fragiforme]KAI2603460.1 hypothetical protein GGS25DRAFT_526498 [Hypoxylon fragiforme]